MKLSFFVLPIETLQELKRQYKRLALANHPDIGGNLEDMKTINNEYEYLFESVSKGSKFEKDRKADIDDGFREMVDKIIYCQGLEIEICGTWIWVGGNTIYWKDHLKKSGYSYAGQKKQWYWHSKEENYKKMSKKSIPMEQIRLMYGSERVEIQENKQTRIHA